MAAGDVTLYCIGCNQPFTFTEQEQKFFASRNIVNPPERCKTCRAQKKMRANQSLTLTCVDCHQPFVFTKGEQEFYQQKGMSAPTRCKECRERRKQERQSNSTGRTQPEEPRVKIIPADPRYYDVVCADCHGEFRVSFQPIPGKDIYCLNCVSRIFGLDRAFLLRKKYGDRLAYLDIDEDDWDPSTPIR